jgi:translation initiation factor IF-2
MTRYISRTALLAAGAAVTLAAAGCAPDPQGMPGYYGTYYPGPPYPRAFPPDYAGPVGGYDNRAVYGPNDHERDHDRRPPPNLQPGSFRPQPGPQPGPRPGTGALVPDGARGGPPGGAAHAAPVRPASGDHDSGGGGDGGLRP